MVGWVNTTQAIARANDAFEPMAYEALLLDPALCRMILRGGSNSGKFALAIAYAMMISAVAPMAVSDLRMVREMKRTRESEYKTEPSMNHP